MNPYFQFFPDFNPRRIIWSRVVGLIAIMVIGNGLAWFGLIEGLHWAWTRL